MLQFTTTTTTTKNWHPRLNQVIYFLHIGSVLFELSQNLLDRYKQQTMEEAEQHGGTFLFFMIPLEKMQFSYFGHVRRPNIAFSYISHYFSADRSRSTGG